MIDDLFENEWNSYIRYLLNKDEADKYKQLIHMAYRLGFIAAKSHYVQLIANEKYEKSDEALTRIG